MDVRYERALIKMFDLQGFSKRIPTTEFLDNLINFACVCLLSALHLICNDELDFTF